VPEHGREIARGGRYNQIGAVFGRSRAAMGFSADLKTLVSLSVNENENNLRSSVFAPDVDAPDLEELIRQLRRQGHVVIRALPGQEYDAAAMGCDQYIVLSGSQWVLEAVN